MNLLNKLVLSILFISTVALPQLRVGQTFTKDQYQKADGSVQWYFVNPTTKKGEAEPTFKNECIEFVRSYADVESSGADAINLGYLKQIWEFKAVRPGTINLKMFYSSSPDRFEGILSTQKIEVVK
jgi:hypothetical protein